MTAEELKASVLQMAMEGKLVPQSDDEPAVDIDAEELEDVPFAIPDKWKWCSLMDVVEAISSKQYQIQTKDVLKNGKYPVVSQSKDLLDGYCNDRNKLLEKNNIPIVVFGDHTKVVKFINFQFIVGADGTKLLHNKSNINIKYLYYVIKYNIIGIKNGGYSRHFKFLKVRPVPLPPLEEQRRIVDRLDEILPVIEQYGKAHDALQDMEKELPGKLRASLLQEAISGRLVPQRDDEPAVDIDAEEPDDVPFDIPKKWKWCKIEDVIEKHIGGGTPSKLELSYWGGCIPWASVKDLKGNHLDSTQDYITREGLYNSTSNIVPSGNIIICLRMGIGKIVFNNIDVAINQDLRGIILNKYILKEYFYYFYNTIKIKGSGATVKGIKISEILHMMLPLPPIEEQRRIVERLNELLPSVEAMEKLYQQ